MGRRDGSGDGSREQGVDTDAPTVGSATESMGHSPADLPDAPDVIDEASTRELIDARPRATVRPGTQIDAFQVVRRIGRGGMGEVYLARDTRLGRLVALKVIQRRILGSGDAIARFLFEARITARFNHPHIVTVHGVGEFEGSPYLALEYLEGQNLRQRMKERQPSLREALRFGRAIAEALAEAHGAGVLHRDLKPANVLIPRDGRPRVVDFGLAETLHHESTGRTAYRGVSAEFSVAELRGEKPALYGTPAYMSPELWKGEESTEATDIWALGLLLHELFTGTHPYRGGEAVAPLILRVCSSEPVPLGRAILQAPETLRRTIEACLDKDPDRRPRAETVARTLADLLERRPGDLAEDESPYPGLHPFTDRHAPLYFGRRGEIAAFSERLRSETTLAVVGPSGAGKTSFVQAGIIPRLQEQRPWRIVALRPGANPFLTLAKRLTSLGARPVEPEVTRGDVWADSLAPTAEFQPGDAGESATRPPPTSGEVVLDDEQLTELAARFRRSPRLLTLQLLRACEEAGSPILLFVDQLEELHTQVADEDTRRAFMEAICSAADDPAGPIRVVFTLRDDYLGRLAYSAPVRDALSRVAVLRTLGRDALLEVLVRPLEMVGGSCDDPDLPGSMVDEVEGEPTALPLLQFAARTLWERRASGTRRLRRADYDAVGGVAGALAEHADAVLQGLSTGQLRAARELLLRLVTPEGTRRTLTRAQAIEALGADGEQALVRLTRSRLITLRRGSDGAGAESELELVHESLIHTWGQLRAWLDENREERAILAQAEEAAALWDRRGRREEEVWRGDALRDGQRLLGDGAEGPPPLVAEFLEMGRLAETRRARRRRRWTVAAMGALSAIAIGALIVAGALAEKEKQARLAREVAEERRVEALIEGATTALARGAFLEARAKVRTVLEEADSPLARALWWRLEREPCEWDMPVGEDGNAVAFSPDGGTVAVGTGAGVVLLVDRETTERRVLRGHSDQVYSLAFSPDGRALATGTWEGDLWIWDLETGDHREFGAHGAAIQSLAFDAAGQRLVSAGEDQVVRIWSVDDGSTLAEWADLGSRLYSVAWSPDEKMIATGGRDGVIRLRSLGSEQPGRDLKGRTGSVTGLIFPPGGETLVASNGVELRVWDLATGEVRQRLRGHTSLVWSVALMEDGRTLISGSADNGIRLWDLETGQETAQIVAHEGDVYSMVLSPDGRYVASTGGDDRLRLWSVETLRGRGRATSHAEAVVGLDVHPDGARIASASTDRTVREWDVATGAVIAVRDHKISQLRSLRYGPKGDVLAAGDRERSVRLWLPGGRGHLLRPWAGTTSDLAFSRDGESLVATHTNRRATVWSLSRREMVRDYQGHRDTAEGVAIHPDGRTVATSDRAGEIHLWDLGTGRVRRILDGGDQPVWGLAFHPDGRSLASAGSDGTVRLWDPQSGEHEVVATFDARAYYLSFDPAGERLAVPCSDGVARIVDLEDRAVVELRGHRGEVNVARFVGDGSRVATTSDDGTVRLWDTATGRPAWYGAVLSESPVALLRHGGWRELEPDGSDQDPAPVTAWRQAVEERGRTGQVSPGAGILCLKTLDGAVEIWDLGADRLEGRREVAGAAQLVAADAGCAILARETGRASLLTLDGEVTPLAGEATAVGTGGRQVLVVTGDEILAFGETGSETGRWSGGSGAVAVTRAGERIVLGFPEGGIEVMDPAGGTPTILLDEPPASPPIRLATGPGDTVFAGFADGSLGVWYAGDGTLLERMRLHGPLVHLRLGDASLHAATELGDHRSVDLGALVATREVLLGRVRGRTPVMWQGGQAVRAHR